MASRDPLSRASKRRNPNSQSDANMAATVSDTGNAVTNGTNLQTAINNAVAGDTIVLVAGAEYRGNFTLPNFTGTTPIRIRSTVGLPIGRRVSASTTSSMAKLTTANSSPVLNCLSLSHHWTLSGLEITTTSAPYTNGVSVPGLMTSDPGITYGNWPTNIIVDRCVMHPNETDPLPYRAAECALVIDGESITYSNNYIYDFMGWSTPQATGTTVSSCTTASPAVAALSASIGGDPGHAFFITFSGATAGWTPLNGTKLATWVDSTHVSLQDYDPVSFALSNVNTVSSGSFSGQSISQLSQNIATSRDILIQVGPGPYTVTNNFLEAYYSPIFSGGASGTWLDPQNDVTVSSVPALNQVVLSGVGQLQIGDMIAFGDAQDQTISGATAGSPTSLTVTAHQFPSGTRIAPVGYITVSGFTGAWAACNGQWATGTALAGNSTHITIPVDSTAFGAVTGSGMKWVLRTNVDSTPNSQWQVGHVTNISGTTVTYEWWGHQPENVNGNGAGILVAVGSPARFRGLVPSGLTLTKNTISNRQSWISLFRDVAKTYTYGGSTSKASWEAKTFDSVTVTGNIFQVVGADTTLADPVALALNQANQNGSTPWVTLNNWTIQSNIFRNLSYQLISLLEEYLTGSISTSFSITNNVLTNSMGAFIALDGTVGATFAHNTVRNFGAGSLGNNAFFMINRGPNTTLTIQNNIGNWVTYGYNDLVGGFAPTTRDHNFLIDNLSQGFTPPTGDTRVPDDATMLFVNAAAADAGGDYHGYALQAGSPGHLACDSGTTDAGVNFTTLDAALTGNDGWTGV